MRRDADLASLPDQPGADQSAIPDTLKLGRQILSTLCNRIQGTITVPATLAASYNSGTGGPWISHDMVPLDPYPYARPLLGDDLAQDTPVAAEVTKDENGDALFFNRAMDYFERGDALRTSSYAGGDPDAPRFAPAAQFSPYLVAMRYSKMLRPKEKVVHGAVPFRTGHPQHATHWLVPRRRMAVPYQTSNFPARPSEDASDADKHRYAAFVAGVYLEDEVVEAAVEEAGVSLWDWLQGWLSRASPGHADPDRSFAAMVARIIANVDGRVQTAVETTAIFQLKRAQQRAAGVEPSGVQTSHDDDTGGPDEEAVFEDSDDDDYPAPYDAAAEPDRDPGNLLDDTSLPSKEPTAQEAYIANLLAPLTGVSLMAASTETAYGNDVAVPGSADAKAALQASTKDLAGFRQPLLPEEATDRRFVLMRDPADNVLKPAYSVVPRPPEPEPTHFFVKGKVPFAMLDAKPSIEDTIELFTLNHEQAVPFAVLAQALLNRVRPGLR